MVDKTPKNESENDIKFVVNVSRHSMTFTKLEIRTEKDYQKLIDTLLDAGNMLGFAYVSDDDDDDKDDKDDKEK